MFNRMPQDDVIIDKQNGTKIKNIKANIGVRTNSRKGGI